jgi:DNA recombination protein RmuC
MSETNFLILLATLLVIAVLQVVLLLRKPRVDLPPEWLAQLQRLEQSGQATLMAVAKNDGALDGMTQQLQSFAQTTNHNLESVRQMVDAKLAQVVGESRAGRSELLAAFSAFESKQEQRLSAVEAALGQRFAALQVSTVASLEASRKALDDKLALAQGDALAGRKEVSDVLTTFRAELTVAVAKLASETQQSRSALADSATLMETHIQQRFDALTAATRQTLDSLKGDLTGQLGAMSSAMSGALKDQLEGNGHQIRNQFTVLQDAVSQQLGGLVQGSHQNAEQLRAALNERLAAIQADNTAKLEEMRRTVDEKLHATLEQRLGESFKHVSDRLEQVHKGLGEMQTLAQGVGDLKHLLSNVKTRGIFGEAQLANLLEQVFVPDQYAAQVATRPGSKNVVDFAVKLPGNSEHGEPLWLPIDAKFPNEDYERLLDAQGRADTVGADAAGKALELRIRLEAKSISEKYVEPPHTTDFAILFLPTEGLYAEVLRRPGLMEALRREYRVTLAGPTTLLAMLSSLQMGFRTLALQKRSSEVWQVLGAVKTEFSKFGAVLSKVKSQTETVLKTLDSAEVRSRAMGRALKKVEAMPESQVQALIPIDRDFDGDGADVVAPPGHLGDE